MTLKMLEYCVFNNYEASSEKKVLTIKKFKDRVGRERKENKIRELIFLQIILQQGGAYHCRNY